MFKPSKQFIIELISITFISLFIYAATAKLLDFQKFKDQIGQSAMLYPYSSWTPFAILILEYLLSLIFLIKKWRLFALYGSLSLMLIFSTYIVIITRYSDYTPCSCSEVLEKMSWNQHLMFNIVFIILAIAVILLFPEKYHEVEEFSAQKAG